MKAWATVLSQIRVVTPTATIEQGLVAVDKAGRIAYVGPAREADGSGEQVLELGGLTVVPGLIDIHVHGGNGIDFGVCGQAQEDLDAYSRWVAGNGVTGFLCSLAAPDAAGLLQIVREYVQALDAGAGGAEALGVHLEGPFLNPRRKGAFSPAWLRAPSWDELDALLEAGRGWIRQVTLSPELPGAGEVAARLRAAGVVAAMGHTDASYELASQALRSDFQHVTHTFNAQRGFAHREPGAVGAILASDGVTAELIADTVHVHPGAMKVLVRCLGAERVVLVSDAMAAAGLADGDYGLVGEEVFVRNGRATLRDGTIAGSTATLNECVHHMQRDVGIALADAVRMATLNPAQTIGVAGRLGTITVGKDASLAVVDDEMNVELALVKGRVVFRRS